MLGFYDELTDCINYAGIYSKGRTFMEQIQRLEEMLLVQLGKHGFKKKRRNTFVRKENDCIQHMTILSTKKRGENTALISINIGFTYERINKIIAFIQEERYDNRWATASINLATLINRNEPYNFYINEEQQLDSTVEDITKNIESYAFDFWGKSNKLEKYYDLLKSENEIIRMATFPLKRPEWSLLALSILLKKDSYYEILQIHREDFEKNNFSINKIRSKENDVKREFV